MNEMVKIVEQDHVFQNWIYGLTDNAKVQYLYALADFCIAIEKTPDEILEICNKEREELPFWDQSINSWLPKYDDHCISIDRARTTRNLRRGLILNFFNCNKIETPKPTKRKPRSFRIANNRELPSKEDIKIFLDACNTIKQKAIILTQLSSGLSNSDVCNLSVGQFKDGLDDNDLCSLSLVREKIEIEFITYMSPEAVNAIKTYLKTERRNLKDNQPLFTQHTTNDQPFKSEGIGYIYKRINDKLGWDKGGNTFRKITGHMCRKWFNTQLTIAGMPEEIRELFMGHKISNKIKDAYFLGRRDDLKKVYIQYLPHITINPTETITIEHEDVKKIKKENLALQAQLNQQSDQFKALNNRISAKEEIDMQILEIDLQISEATLKEDFNKRRVLIEQKSELDIERISIMAANDHKIISYYNQMKINFYEDRINYYKRMLEPINEKIEFISENDKILYEKRKKETETQYETKLNEFQNKLNEFTKSIEG